MTVLADQITYGFVGGTIVAAICLLLSLATAFLGLIGIRDTSASKRKTARWEFFWGCLAALVTVIVWLAASWPLKYDYHHWVDKSGTVEKVASRLIPAGEKSVQQRIVVVLNGQPYGVDDTRAALLKPGDRVSLRCRKENEWGTPQQAHGWKCKWNGGPSA